MIVNIKNQGSDDTSFLLGLNSLISHLILETAPQAIYIVRVGKWFDHKWLNYSGKGRVKFDGYPANIDTALDALWKDKITFPPFNPKQIESETYFERNGSGSYDGGSDEPKWLHEYPKKSSAANLNNRLENFVPSGLFVWFSSMTAANDHGCVMVYSNKNSDISTWYASFIRDKNWCVNSVKGIGKNYVVSRFPVE